MLSQREQEAIFAYIKFIQKKGASASSADQRQTILQRLSPYIANVSNDGTGYREGVDAYLGHVNKSDWPFVLLVIREFFPFWTGNIKLIAALSADEAYEKEPVQWQALSGNLATLWASLDMATYKPEDMKAIEAYVEVLKQNGAQPSLIDTRIKIIKLLLLRLKDASQRSAKLYRKATDATVSIFEQKETRYLFLAVVREYYYFWIGDPEAERHVNEGKNKD